MGNANSGRFILGSASPRRLELLGQLGLKPDDVRSPDIDEIPHRGELPRPYCQRIAREKAQSLSLNAGDVLLCADTTVAVGRRILGKPEDWQEAKAFLGLLSGRRHRVITAIAVRRDDHLLERDVVTNVRMRKLCRQDILGYLETGDWQGKAGGYAIQGPAAAFIPWIQGSFSAVMGLPLAETATVLAAMGIRPGPVDE